ncbi:hypothetical protein EV702DRAFT_1151019 [Suillus placidus]|uniref:Secreted protein n=1 Tax=Suillus placidus TaxID=48579 RepID=A0A9P6ZHK4_9AGAM|nr:hypothetical protein EV702DRAFT_1151019 [Suillus placidus]
MLVRFFAVAFLAALAVATPLSLRDGQCNTGNIRTLLPLLPTTKRQIFLVFNDVLSSRYLLGNQTCTQTGQISETPSTQSSNYLCLPSEDQRSVKLAPVAAE